MKISELKKLGFKKTHITKEESGEDAFDYYTLEIGDDYEKFCLISKEVINKEIEYVELFNYTSFRFTTIKDIKVLIDILKISIYNKI
mgnify:FL=1|jgi:hypothetical protein